MFEEAEILQVKSQQQNNSCRKKKLHRQAINDFLMQ